MNQRATTDRLWEIRLLIIVTSILIVFGIASLAGAAMGGVDFALKQAIGILTGLVALVVCATLRYSVWRRLAWPLLIAVAVLLVVVLLPFTRSIAPEINGARRWIVIGWITLQPGELAKFALVVWVAMLAAKKGSLIEDFKTGVLPFLVVLVPIIGLISLEPHLSMAVTIAIIAAILLFAAGIKLRHFAALGGAALALLALQVVHAPYRVARVLTFLNPGGVPADQSAQIKQSLVGMGAGGLLGVGFGEGQQKLGYVPYSYSDFIFSTIGEEWGFAGVLALAMLFGTYLWVGLRIARSAVDPLGRFLALGCAALVGLTALLHMAVNLSLLPTTGLTLPFISYGRSSLVVSMAATGVLLSVARART